MKSLYEIPPGCICQGDGLLGMRCPAPKHATKSAATGGRVMPLPDAQLTKSEHDVAAIAMVATLRRCADEIDLITADDVAFAKATMSENGFPADRVASIDRAEVAAAQFRVTARDVMEKLDQVKGLRAGLEGA